MRAHVFLVCARQQTCAVSRTQVRAAVILSLAYCYHARLPREERRQFCKHLEDAWRHLQVRAAWV